VEEDAWAVRREMGLPGRPPAFQPAPVPAAPSPRHFSGSAQAAPLSQTGMLHRSPSSAFASTAYHKRPAEGAAAGGGAGAPPAPGPAAFWEPGAAWRAGDGAGAGPEDGGAGDPAWQGRGYAHASRGPQGGESQQGGSSAGMARGLPPGGVWCPPSAGAQGPAARGAGLGPGGPPAQPEGSAGGGGAAPSPATSHLQRGSAEVEPPARVSGGAGPAEQPWAFPPARELVDAAAAARAPGDGRGSGGGADSWPLLEQGARPAPSPSPHPIARSSSSRAPQGLCPDEAGAPLQHVPSGGRRPQGALGAGLASSSVGRAEAGSPGGSGWGWGDGGRGSPGLLGRGSRGSTRGGGGEHGGGDGGPPDELVAAVMAASAAARGPSPAPFGRLDSFPHAGSYHQDSSAGAAGPWGGAGGGVQRSGGSVAALGPGGPLARFGPATALGSFTTGGFRRSEHSLSHLQHLDGIDPSLLF
jgi:hypothetical protein